jgi:hypothetical protein
MLQADKDCGAKVISKVAVNSDPVFPVADASNKVADLTVRVIAEEDCNVYPDGGGSVTFAQKAVKQIQEAGPVAAGPVGRGAERPLVLSKEKPSEEKPGVLKNIVDKIMDRLNTELPMLHTHDKYGWLVGGIALGLSIAAIAVAIIAL